MLSPLRNRLGIPGVISVIALVFAMLGGAYASSNSGEGKATASAKQKSKKGSRGRQGTRGKQGPVGPQGPIGAQGPVGPAGPGGADGADGAQGKAGAAGQGVSSAPLQAGEDPECPEGGTKFVSGGLITYACDGKIGEDGEPGEDGSPWTVGGVLPPGETVTGTYAFLTANIGDTILGSPVSTGFAPISFTLPLSSAPSVVFVESGTTPSCQGPGQAAPGTLCVYADRIGGAIYDNGGIGLGPKVTTSGAVLRFVSAAFAGAPQLAGHGHWAVTASTAP